MQTQYTPCVGVALPWAGVVRLLAMVCAMLAMGAWATNASAHASLISSTPANGAVLERAPEDIRLSFNEPVSPLVLKLIQPDGATVDITQAQAEPAGLRVSLPLQTQQGAYALSWRVVSADGHPVGGTLVFSVGTGAGGANMAVSPTQPLRAGLIWLARVGGYLGLFFGVGMALWHTMARSAAGMVAGELPACAGVANDRDHQGRGTGRSWLVLGAGATLLNLGLLGVDALDAPITGLFHAEAWRVAVSTSYGVSAGITLAALACATFVWHAKGAIMQRAAAGLALILLGAALAASGHASAAPPAWLARPAVWLHVVAVTLWTGAFLPLAHALREPTGAGLLRRFSRAIPPVLVALIGSGGVLVFLQLDTPSSLWTTDYGRVLSMKLVGVSLLLALGAYNRYRLTAVVLRGAHAQRRAMRRLIHVECLVAILILSVVALWRFTPPPRALSSVSVPAAPAASVHIHTDIAMADVALTPGPGGGPATLTLYLSRPDLMPLAVQEVDVVFFSDNAGLEPIVFPATAAPDGTWRVDALALPQHQRWRVRIDALISDFERIRLEGILQ